MICINLIILLHLHVLTSIVLSTEIDYYWRNYNGDIPSDAFQAGLDESGKPIYIGQAFFEKVGLLPGTLHPLKTNFRATAQSKVFSTDKYVKILCTRRPSSFIWVRVNSQADIADLTDVHVVEGGLETNSVLYVGRIRHEGDLEIGKIYNLGRYKGLALPNQEGSETDYLSFDILTYDLKSIDDDDDDADDVRNNIFSV